jgi:hypothetical protein
VTADVVHEATLISDCNTPRNVFAIIIMACTVLGLKVAALHRAQAIRIKSAVEAEETPCIASHAR